MQRHLSTVNNLTALLKSPAAVTVATNKEGLKRLRVIWCHVILCILFSFFFFSLNSRSKRNKEKKNKTETVSFALWQRHCFVDLQLNKIKCWPFAILQIS